jgi:PiT family inorganic phosphate transporter
VSVGSLFGIGLVARKAAIGVVLGVVLSWLLTLPCAALISGGVYWLAGHASQPR